MTSKMQYCNLCDEMVKDISRLHYAEIDHGNIIVPYPRKYFYCQYCNGHVKRESHVGHGAIDHREDIILYKIQRLQDKLKNNDPLTETYSD